MTPRILAVSGAGTMGAGIAQVAAQAGWEVRLYDLVEGSALRGKRNIAAQLEKRVASGKMTAESLEALLGRIQPCDTFKEALTGIDLFIEAVVEDIEVKRQVFGRASEFAPQNAILATNTSSLSITVIASGCARPERVCGMHFFNPAPIMSLVEVIRGDQSSEATLETVTAIAREWGKTPVTAKDTPGFIVNRCARSFYGESLRILGENLADTQTIDRIMTGVGGFRMGPFQLMDLVGVDVNLAVTKSVYHAFFEEPRFRPHPIQQKMVDAGLLGRKTKKGFYTYPES